MAAKAPEANWARLSAGIIYDPDWLAAGAPGRLCFLTSIALAKATNRDGEFNLATLKAVMAGVYTGAQVVAAAAQLCDLRLWEFLGNQTYRLRSWAKWNETVADQEVRRERRQRGARIANHKQGRHDKEPEDDCPLCRSSDAIANGPATVERTTPTSLDADADADADADPPLPPPPRSSVGAAGPPEVAAEVVELADRLVGALGYATPEPARPDERRYVARALARGWTPEQLEDLAWEAASREGVDDVRRYLLGGLRTRANEDPAATAPAEPRPLLHDQRPPCPNPECVDGWVGSIGPDGRPETPERCPDCTGVRA